jgi:DNA-binding CsgD family transcriptional regulator/Flp pilus assembly protein TadD
MSSFRPGATEDFAAADAAALRLRQLDQGNHAAYAILGHVAMRRLRHDEALANLCQAHDLNPNDVTTLRWLAWEEANWGMADAAREHAAMAMRLSPRDRAIDLGYWTVALAAFVAGEGERCLENAKRAIALNRRFAGHYILLAACLAEHGDLAEAKATAEVAMAMAPGLIESRAAGNTYFVAPSLAERYAHALRRAIGERAAPAPPAAVPATGEPPAPLETLTARECQVLRLVAQGLSNPAIAMALALSEHTVKRHVANILTKLDLPTRAAASALAARRGLL